MRRLTTRERRFAGGRALLITLATIGALALRIGVLPPAAGAAEAKTGKDAAAAKDVPRENPLRKADEATRRHALTEAWTTYQRSCRPCHGSSGAGDGPHAVYFPRRATDLRRPNSSMAPDAVRFRRIRDGAAALSERPWESSMPAFGTELTAPEIWGLVLLLEQLGRPDSGIDPAASAADVYAERCQVCHGSGGAGDGPLAPELLPRPRDLVRADYRLRSTVYGSAPLDSDIIGSIARGLGKTSMGGFLPLGSLHLEDLGAHLIALAPDRFKAEAVTVPVTVVPAIPSSELVARGRGIYAQADCAECHGKQGRGDGPKAAALKDDTGRPAIPTDLTERWENKRAGTSTDIFRSVSTGLNGTPMRGYFDEISAEDRWSLAYYVESLGRLQPRYPTAIFPRTVADDLPLDPDASLWSTIPPTVAPLGPQMEAPPYWSQPSVEVVDVSVAVSKSQIAILLKWNDRTRDVRTDDGAATRSLPETLERSGSWRLPDQVAVQFPVSITPASLPHPYLGDPGHAVRRWRWSADRQEAGQDAVLEEATGIRRPLTPKTDAPAVKTLAKYGDGQWRVVLIGNLPEKKPASLPIAVQAWDGAAGEAGNWFSASPWLSITLP